jgi:hypothetical protein
MRPITSQEVNMKQINNCQAAADAYQKAMSSLKSNWLAKEELAKKRGLVHRFIKTFTNRKCWDTFGAWLESANYPLWSLHRRNVSVSKV